MSIDEMQQATKGAKDHECPSQALHEAGCTGIVDYVSGQELVPGFMAKLRRDKVAYF